MGFRLQSCHVIARLTGSKLMFGYGLSATAILVGVSSAQVPAIRPSFDAFEVATIKQSEPEASDGRYLKMLGDTRFVAKNYTLKLLIAAAFDLNPKTISGGPGWTESEHFDVEAVTPETVRPNHDEQMKMLRSLLVERFRLKFHREPREFSVYAIEVMQDGPKLTSASKDAATVMGPGVVYPQKIVLPARNATIAELASLLQRAIVDRPVVDRTGLKGRYDFDLEWAPDESQFGGDIPKAGADTPAAPLFEAMQQELGLKLRPTRGEVQALVLDGATRPTRIE